MSTSRNAEAPSGGFSYAMAAKGRSPAASAKASGAATPSSGVAAEDVDGIAVDSHTLAKAEALAGGDSSSVTSANHNDDSSSTANAASSESTWDSKSQTSERQTKTADTNGSDASDETPKQQKPKLQDAPPPAVNVWQQRAQALAQVKPAPAPAKQEKKSEPKRTQDAKKPASSSPRSREQRQTPDAARARSGAAAAAATAAAPPVNGNETAWPSMETAREEDRKKAQVQEEKAVQKEPSAAPAPKAGRTEWVNLPYVPTAVFETSLPTRGGARTGRGGARGGSQGSARSPVQNSQGAAAAAAAADKPHSRSDEASQDPSVKVDADRESMPPPPSKPVKVDDAKDATLGNGASPTTNAPPKRHSSTRRDRSPRKHDKSGRRPSVASAVAEAINGHAAESTKPAAKDRPFDNPPPFRDGKGGKRGRGGHRGLNGGHFPAQQYTNGFSAEFPAAPYPQRGGHFSQQSRSGGYRNSASHSQSIHFDYGRGQYPGYPMVVPPGYAPDYYGGYSPTAVPAYQPGMEQMFLVPLISQQIEYYFSVENLIKDLFFRKHMDSQGFVFLSLVADFNRLKSLTTDYELLKYVCLNSPNIELRVGQDGKDRLRKAGDWERWVLAMGERDASAQNEGPSSLERPALPSLGMAAPFYPAGVEQFADATPSQDEFRGRQAKSPSRESGNGMSPMGNLFVPAEDMGSDPDTFPNEHIDNLTVVVRKHEPAQGRAPYHTAGSRTFSDGSIDSKNIYEEVQKTKDQDKKTQTDGEVPTNGDSASADGPAVTLFWVKDHNQPVETLPPDTTHEMYSHLRTKALSQREVAATGTCPYDMDVLYQFWSHFLIRNFNSSMYAEFRHLAFADAAQRHNATGINNLVKYYSEALGSQMAVRDRVARHFIDLVKSEGSSGERVAFTQLRSSWRSGALNLKNRKKLADLLDADLKSELEA